MSVSGKKNIACFSLFFWCPYPRTLQNPELSSAASMINYRNILTIMFQFCNVLILLSIRSSAFHLWKAWLLPPCCSYNAKSISHLKLSSQYTLRHVLQYHAFCNISSFTNLEQVFTKYSTYLDSLAGILHLIVYIFLLNPCREKSYLSNVSLQ